MSDRQTLMLTVPCPVCGAAVGVPCLNRSPHSVEFHQERYNAAVMRLMRGPLLGGSPLAFLRFIL